MKKQIGFSLVLIFIVSMVSVALAAKAGYQVKAAEGNIGNWVFDGKIKLNVIKIECPDMAAQKGSKNQKSGKKDYVVTFTAKNGSAKKYFMAFKSAFLADNAGESYESRTLYFSYKLLPGAAKTSKLTFRIPADFKPTKVVINLDEIYSKHKGYFRIFIPEGYFPEEEAVEETKVIEKKEEVV
ncbi:MAG: DUF4352 domain-containing protein, partial [bacterium]